MNFQSCHCHYESNDRLKKPEIPVIYCEWNDTPLTTTRKEKCQFEV